MEDTTTDKKEPPKTPIRGDRAHQVHNNFQARRGSSPYSFHQNFPISSPESDVDDIFSLPGTGDTERSGFSLDDDNTPIKQSTRQEYLSLLVTNRSPPLGSISQEKIDDSGVPLLSKLRKVRESDWDSSKYNLSALTFDPRAEKPYFATSPAIKPEEGIHADLSEIPALNPENDGKSDKPPSSRPRRSDILERHSVGRGESGVKTREKTPDIKETSISTNILGAQQESLEGVSDASTSSTTLTGVPLPTIRTSDTYDANGKPPQVVHTLEKLKSDQQVRQVENDVEEFPEESDQTRGLGAYQEAREIVKQEPPQVNKLRQLDIRCSPDLVTSELDGRLMSVGDTRQDPPKALPKTEITPSASSERGIVVTVKEEPCNVDRDEPQLRSDARFDLTTPETNEEPTRESDHVQEALHHVLQTEAKPNTCLETGESATVKEPPPPEWGGLLGTGLFLEQKPKSTSDDDNAQAQVHQNLPGEKGPDDIALRESLAIILPHKLQSYLEEEPSHCPAWIPAKKRKCCSSNRPSNIQVIEIQQNLKLLLTCEPRAAAPCIENLVTALNFCESHRRPAEEGLNFWKRIFKQWQETPQAVDPRRLFWLMEWINALKQVPLTSRPVPLKTQHGTFLRYFPRKHKDREVSEVLEEVLKRPVPNKAFKEEGFMYIYWLKGGFGYSKIGRAVNVQTRLKAWAKCTIPQRSDAHAAGPLELQLHYPTKEHTVQSVRNYARVETLVHAELKDYRWTVECAGCGTTHKEWFTAEVDVAQEIIEKWMNWMRQHEDKYEFNETTNKWVLGEEELERARKGVCQPHARLIRGGVKPLPNTSKLAGPSRPAKSRKSAHYRRSGNVW